MCVHDYLVIHLLMIRRYLFSDRVLIILGKTDNNQYLVFIRTDVSRKQFGQWSNFSTDDSLIRIYIGFLCSDIFYIYRRPTLKSFCHTIDVVLRLFI